MAEVNGAARCQPRVVAAVAERCDAGGTGGARGKSGGDGPVRAARKALTGGSRRHRGWSVRRLAPWRVHGRRPVAPPATRGCWEVESEARGAAGRLGREGGAVLRRPETGGAHGHVHADPGMVQTMPMSASTSFSHLRAPKEMWFASLCAKFQDLPDC